MLINVNILCFINIGIPCKHLFGSFTASAIRSQHRTFFNINKNSQQIIFYDLRCESLFRMYEFLWNTWLIFSSVTVQYLTVTRKNPFQIGCADRIFAFYSKFSYGQRSKCADLPNSYKRPQIPIIQENMSLSSFFEILAAFVMYLTHSSQNSLEIIFSSHSVHEERSPTR